MRKSLLVSAVLLIVLLMLNLVSPTEYNTNVFQRGDVNEDNKLDINDVYYLADYIFGKVTKTIPLELGDFDQGGDINIGDVTALIQYLRDNGTIKQDTIAPVIVLNSPKDNVEFKTSESEKEITFRFTASDGSEIKSCSLIINGRVEKTLNNVQKNVEQIIKLDLDRDDYDWLVECSDIYNNIGKSETRDFEIKKKADSTNNNPDLIGYNNPDVSNTKETVKFMPQDSTINLTKPEVIKKSFNFSILALILLIALIILVLAMIIVVLMRRR